MADGLSFDAEELMELAEVHHDAYVSATPFPHVVIDDFVPDSVIDALLGEFPSPQDEVEWQRLNHGQERKLALADDGRMGPVTRQVLSQFNSAAFVDFLEAMTDISGLIPDPHFVGGGLHQIEPGGFLGVHADFNVHKRLRLDRRLNVLLYLNRNWADEYGGHLQLWDRDMRICEKAI
jgi:Rps23 Pro-64 3,4-dihydroxylase Tpa1-like proline 4-hydroxylase